MSGPVSIFRLGLGAVQAIARLFGAGAVLFGAHTLFLRYYANEWGGIQFAGVNGCAGESMVANGDLIEGQTFCNKPENFVPWIEIYRRHWQAAAIYYGLALVVILLIGLALHAMQKRQAPTAPFGGPQRPATSADAEHLR